MECILCKIDAGRFPAQKVPEADLPAAIRDLRSRSPTLLLLPRQVQVGALAEPLGPAPLPGAGSLDP